MAKHITVSKHALKIPLAKNWKIEESPLCCPQNLAFAPCFCSLSGLHWPILNSLKYCSMPMIPWDGPLNILLFKEYEKAAGFKGDFSV